MAAQIPKESITAVVLAGGRGMRMGGVDKGLQLFGGTALAHHALQRLALQVGSIMINANRNIEAYEAFGTTVVSDDNALGEFAGPLAGMITGLQNCQTPYLLTVPCDAPLFPADLAARLAFALRNDSADIAVACADESTSADDSITTRKLISDEKMYRPQPVFSLMKVSVLKSLLDFTQSGGRKVSEWMARCQVALVPFNESHDAPDAFFNANTLAQLHRAQLLSKTSL